MKSMQLKRVLVGTRYFHDSVDATDPCYDNDVWCRVNNIPIISGDYECVAWVNEEEGRVMICGIYLNECPEEDEFEYIGEAGVDAGLCGFFENKPNYSDSAWNDFCNDLGMEDYKIIDEGFFTSSGYGDGGYDVMGYKEGDSDRYSALEIRF